MTPYGDGLRQLHRIPVAACFRAILQRMIAELALPNVHYVNGLRLLSDARGLSEDLVHPSVRGVETIAHNLT